MKKYSKIGYGFLFVAALALAGCGKSNQSQNGQTPASSSQDDTGQSVTETVKQKLSDLITTGAGMKCTIEDPQMGQITMYAKGEKAKVEGFAFAPMTALSNPTERSQPPKEEKGTMVNDGEWVYMWSGKEGMKFNIKEMENLAPKDQGQNQGQSQSNASDWKDWVKEMDEKGTKYDCDPTALSDGDFAPPVEIQFQDWGEMMKGFMKMGEEMKNKLPDQPPVPLPLPAP